MKILFFIFLISNQVIAQDFWQNPPVVCPEDIMPKGFDCPNLTKVANVFNDFPDDFSDEEINDWKTNRSADLRVCRNKEVLRREVESPGTFGSNVREMAWMTVSGAEQASEKLSEIKKASNKFGMPEQILIGALKQESLMATLGVAADGGNYSCGMSQLNLQEWCRGISKLPMIQQQKYAWPVGISCNDTSLPLMLVKPFYDIAIKSLYAKPAYMLDSSHFKSIQFKDVSQSFPPAENELQIKRFNAVKSFVGNCQNISLSIHLKAQTLRDLFDKFIPTSLKLSQRYQLGQSYQRKCLTPYTSNYYPLHTGWLLAVAMYNAGPLQGKILEHYYQTDSNHLPDLDPKDLIEALHWGGKWKKDTSLIEFKDSDGNIFTQKWYKSCIVQRHVARVVQHVSLPSVSIVKSLEQAPCSPLTDVPDYRKNSSGIK